MVFPVMLHIFALRRFLAGAARFLAGVRFPLRGV